MHLRERLIVTFVVMFLGAQVGTALWQLTAERPARFGWHMYAGLREPLGFTVVRADGSTAPVSMTDYLANHRGDVDVSRLVPPAICAREQAAVQVRYLILPESVDRIYSCAR